MPNLMGAIPMPVFRTRGENSTTVALIPNICHQRLVVYSRNNNNGGWAIRDFITNKILEDENSQRARADIENEIDLNYSEYPPFYAVDDPTHANRWEVYLILRTLAHLRIQSKNYDTTAVVSLSNDRWNDIASAGWIPVAI
jgi:hypothetical protein